MLTQALAEAVAATAPKPAAKATKDAPLSLDVVEPDPVFKTKEERMKHADQVRNEGLMQKKSEDANQEIDLEIEAPGAANSVAEEGAKTIATEEEFKKDTQQLATAR